MIDASAMSIGVAFLLGVVDVAAAAALMTTP